MLEVTLVTLLYLKRALSSSKQNAYNTAVCIWFDVQNAVRLSKIASSFLSQVSWRYHGKPTGRHQIDPSKEAASFTFIIIVTFSFQTDLPSVC